MSSGDEANRSRSEPGEADGGTDRVDEQEGHGLGVRVGSPFAPAEPVVGAGSSTHDVAVNSDVSGNAAGDRGEVRRDAVRYTAGGALWASAIVTGFAAAAVRTFPEGAFPVATLGCGLAIFAFASGRRIVPATLLVVHLAFFTQSVMEIWR